MNSNMFIKILIATWLGWLFDGLDSSLYPLVANEAVAELIKNTDLNFNIIAARIGAIFVLGWALGGYFFGYLGDKIGRAKALSLSILSYAVFCALSSISHSWQEMAFFRFITGLGIGGEWALGVALLAETVHPKKRIMATAFLATGFPVGYFIAVVANHFISPFGWRPVFLIGVIPAILVFFIRRHIQEPEAWTKVKDKISSPLEIFERKYLRNLTIAFFLGVTFSFGAWGCILLWLPLWVERVLGGDMTARTITMLIFMGAHVIGCYLTGPLMLKYSRRLVLFISYLICFFSATFMYYYFTSYGIGVLTFVGIIGLFFGAIPSGFAIYFPELFPTKIRSTAKGFCYNTGRILTAIGLLYSGHLVQRFEGNIGQAAALMSGIFLIGAIVSLFAPKTDIENLPT